MRISPSPIKRSVALAATNNNHAAIAVLGALCTPPFPFGAQTVIRCVRAPSPRCWASLTFYLPIFSILDYARRHVVAFFSPLQSSHRLMPRSLAPRLSQINNEDCIYMIYRKEGSDEWEPLEIGDPPPAAPEAAS